MRTKHLPVTLSLRMYSGPLAKFSQALVPSPWSACCLASACSVSNTTSLASSSSGVSFDRSTCSSLPPSSSSSAALLSASDSGVTAREENVEDGAELSPENRDAPGASNDDPLVDEPKMLLGGGFEGVVEVDGAWNWKDGAFLSVAAVSPNLIGVPCLKV
jgi:hypothetical protein